MRTFTTTHTVYTYDELSDQAKEKARQWWIDGLEYDDLSDAMSEHLTEVLLPKYKMQCDDAKVYYSLSYSQGDGAMFEGTVYWKSWRVDVRQSGHYYHYNSKTFWNTESVKTGKDMPDETAKLFNEQYVALCQELEKYGYDYIEYEQETEVIEDNIRANEYEFYEDGKIA